MSAQAAARGWATRRSWEPYGDALAREAFRRHPPARRRAGAGRSARVRPAAAVASATTLAAAAVASALVLHPKLAVYVVVMAAFFVPAEAFRSIRRHSAFPAGTLTDLTHFVVNKVFSPLGLAGVAVAMGWAIRLVVPGAVPATVGRWPFGVQFVLAVVAAELGGYWAHRWMHRFGWLWRFHKVHHSIGEMGWVAGSRQHPFDWAFSRVCAAVPMLALGLPAGIFGLYGLLSGFNTVLCHSNVRVRFGPLRHLIVTPEFHHWHHADQPEAYNRNFAGQLAILDRLFGTARRGPRGWPERYGIAEPVPSGWLAQIAWPLRASPAGYPPAPRLRPDRTSARSATRR